MIKVRIPTPLRPLTKGQGEVDAQAHTIVEMIDTLNASHPGIKDRLCDDTGELRRFVNIYVNEEDIRFLKGKETSLKDGDEVSIVPAIAGRYTMPNMKVHIRFPEDKIKEPVIYQIGHEFKVVTNVRRADVRETTGWMDLELTGDSTEIERAIAGLRKKGVIVDPIELNVVE